MSQARQLRVLCSSLALVAVLATGAGERTSRTEELYRNWRARSAKQVATMSGPSRFCGRLAQAMSPARRNDQAATTDPHDRGEVVVTTLFICTS